MMTFTYYDYKRKYFSEEEILNKEKTLRNMMKPNTIEELNEMCLDAGFDYLQSFWQNYNFVAFIA